MIDEAMGALAAERPLFHSEADFQHALAWRIQRLHPSAAVRLETRPRRGIRLDVLVRLDGRRIGLELKYLVKGMTVDLADERFDLPNQGAHDISRYDVCKDIRRTEVLIEDGYADEAHTIVLSNDAGYWQSGRKVDPVDAAFRLTEGRVLSGTLAWSEMAGVGTTRGREAPIALAGSYPCRWRPYSRVPGAKPNAAEFRYLTVQAHHRTPENPPEKTAETLVAARAPVELAGGTARQQVRQAARALAARGQETFSPKDLIDEARRQGATAQDNTLRTHITAYMVANIDTDQGGRWADLERVGRGVYRLVHR